MGGPKPLMDAGGRPWWQVQESRLDAAGIPRLWVLSDDAGAAMLDAGFIPERATIADPDAPMFEIANLQIAGTGDIGLMQVHAIGQGPRRA